MAQITVKEIFDLAVQYHGAGQLPEAEQLYRQILGCQPGHLQAIMNLGAITYLTGRHDDTAVWMRRALSVQPHFPDAQYNLGLALQAGGHLDEAIAAFRQAITLRPDFAEAYGSLGAVLQLQGRFDEALAAFLEAIRVQPHSPEAHSNLAIILRNQGRLGEAVEAFRRAIQLQPFLPEAHSMLGMVLGELGQLNEAIAAFRCAISLRPAFPDFYNHLGVALNAAGQGAEAVAAFRQVLDLQPEFPGAGNNLGVALNTAGRCDEGIAAFRRILALEPESPDVYHNLGTALNNTGQLDEAIAAYRRAITLRPEHAEAHHNLGTALKNTGQLDEAIAACRHALQLRPDFADTHSSLVYTLLFHPAYDARALAAENRRWNLQHGAPLRPEIRPWANDPDPARRLKIGYVSPDFRAQAETFFTLPLLRAHDPGQFEIHCYSCVRRPDAMTATLRDFADVWHEVTWESDARLAERIREDRVDILVDLTMHMADNRLLTFARKPAPVQVAWLAYPGGTGLAAIDYRLTDAFMDPPGGDAALYVEQSVRLPDCWVCYDPLSEPLPIEPLPALQLGQLTFGSLNNFCKLNPEVLTLWAQVLRAVPNSRLLLLAPAGEARLRTAAFLASQGIVPERVEFVASSLREEYLQRYQHIDIALDPFPYNGITTSCDALWMGVPVVTLAGQTPSARAGLGLLSTADLPELVAQTPEEFVQIAVALAHDLPRLAALRASLRGRMERSPLMDAPRFARNIEAAYRQMWESWCATASSL